MPSSQTTSLAIAEAFTADLNSSVVPRWQRKALAVNAQNTSMSFTASHESPSVSTCAPPQCALRQRRCCRHVHHLPYSLTHHLSRFSRSVIAISPTAARQTSTRVTKLSQTRAAGLLLSCIHLQVMRMLRTSGPTSLLICCLLARAARGLPQCATPALSTRAWRAAQAAGRHSRAGLQAEGSRAAE